MRCRVLSLSGGNLSVDDWTPLDDLMRPDDWTPLDRDVLLKGLVSVVVRARDGSPRVGKRVTIRGCGFV